MASTRSKTGINNKRKGSTAESELTKKTKKRVSIYEPNKSTPSDPTTVVSSDNMELVGAYIEGKKPEWDGRVKELWIEALKTPPLALIDDIINTVNDKMYNMLSSLQLSFEKLLPDQDEVAERMVQIDVLLESAVDRNYDVFELYALKNIFSFHPKDPIPPLHYEGFKIGEPSSELDKLEEELKREREKLIGAEYFSYKATSFRNNTIKLTNELDQLVNELVELDDTMNNNLNIPSATELSLNLLKFEKILTKYKESLTLFKDPSTTRPTQRDMFLKIATLNHLTKLVPQYATDTELQVDKQYEAIQGQSWDELLSALEF